MPTSFSRIKCAIRDEAALWMKDKMHERSHSRIEAAKVRGTRFGHPTIEVPGDFDAVMLAFLDGEVTRAEAAKRLGVSKSTFDRWRKAVVV